MPRFCLLAFALALAACGDASTDGPSEKPEPSARSASEVAPGAAVRGDDGPAGALPAEVVREWAGRPVVREDGANFLLQPSVQPALKEAFSVESELVAALAALGETPAYTASTVESVGDALAVTLRPDPDLTDDDRTVWLLIDTDSGEAYALLKGSGFAFYRASFGARVADLSPQAVTWVERQSGEPFGQIAASAEDPILVQ
ncbi:hypothetical protein [Rubrivirga sp.]|uniref:hypothetical protein n=1 Tax=Rubrivirga sp. TaxID=1885344 RepID=UPI003B52B99D